MQRVVVGGFLVLGILTLPVCVSAQRISAMGMSGLVRSGSVSVPAGAEATVLTTSGDRPFILTQVCFDAGGMVLSGATFGAIPGDMGACTTYHPGIALPRNEALICQNPNGVAANCMITGVLTR